MSCVLSSSVQFVRIHLKESRSNLKLSISMFWIHSYLLHWMAPNWIDWINFFLSDVCVCCVCVFLFFLLLNKSIVIMEKRTDWSNLLLLFALATNDNNPSMMVQFQSITFNLIQVYFLLYRPCIILQYHKILLIFFPFVKLVLNCSFSSVLLFFSLSFPFRLSTLLLLFFCSCKRNVKCFLNQIRNTVQWNHHRIHHHT